MTKHLYVLLGLLLGTAGKGWSQTADISTTVGGPQIAQVGTTVTYNVDLFNNGPNTGYISQYVAQLIKGLTNVTASFTYGGTVYANQGTYNSNTGVYTFNNPAPNAPIALGDDIKGTISFTMPNQTVTGKVSCTPRAATDPNAANNDGSSVSANITTQATTSPTYDLVTTLGGPATVNVGQPTSYQVLTVNNGPAAAPNVKQTIQLPQVGGSYPATADVTVSSGSYSAATGLLTFAMVTSLPAGFTSQGAITNYVTFIPRATASSLKVTGSVTSTGVDQSTTNNSQTVSTAVTVLAGTTGSAASCATPGRDGSVTLGANPDTYYPPRAGTYGAGTTSLVLGASRGAGTAIAAGDLLLIIQMQGSGLNATNTDSYGSGASGNPGSGYLTNDGNFRAGQFEYAQAASAVSATTGGTLTLASGLLNSYEQGDATTTLGQRRFQVIRVPQYANLTLSATLRPAAWNGQTGGVLVLDVAGTFSPSGYGLNADGLGFRGGAGRQLPGDGNATALTATDYRASAATGACGTKGEGIAGTPRYVSDLLYSTTALLDTRTATTGYPTLLPGTLADGYPSGDNGRGAPGNAGGGGTDANPAANDQNTSGSGGANGGGGGRGGNSWFSNLLVGGEPSLNFGQAAANRLVMGGGGGSGATNNGTIGNAGFNSSGGAGGGLLIVRAGAVSGAGTLSANGASASSDVANDGTGGGGAGGSVLVTARVTAGLNGLTLSANGGNGGSLTTPTAHGPAGGGGGGILLSNAAVGSTSVTGGANGLFKTSSTDAGIAYGAEPGSRGFANTSLGTDVLTGETTSSACVADVYTTLTGPTTTAAGQPTGTYAVTFGNQGAQAASSVIQTATLPAGASLTAAQRAAIVAAYPGTVFSTVSTGSSAVTTLNFGTLTTLAAGASNAYSFVYTAPATVGTYSTSGASSTTTGSPVEGGLTTNNTATASTAVTAAADVTVSLVGPATLSAGQPTGTFTVTFTNEGPQTASSVARTVTLPAGATLSAAQQSDLVSRYGLATGSFTANSSGQVTINFGSASSLAADAYTAFTFAFTAPTVSGYSVLGGTTSASTSEGSNLAPDAASLSLTTTDAADMQAGLAAGAASYTPGSPATFNVTFRNNGPNTAGGVSYTVQLPAGLSGVSADNGGSYASSTGLVTYPNAAATLAGSGTFTSAIAFTMPATGPVTATAATTTTTFEATTINNVASASVDTAPRFDLATTLSGPAAAVGGSPVSFTITTTTTSLTNGSPAVVGVKERVKLVTGLGQVFVSGSGYYNSGTSAVTGGFVGGNFVAGNGDTIRVSPGWVVFPALDNLPLGETVTSTLAFVAPTSGFAPVATVTPGTTAAGETNLTNNVAYLNGNTTSTSLAVSGSTTATTSANVYTTLAIMAVNGVAVGQGAGTTAIVDAGSTATFAVVVGNKGPVTATGVGSRLQLLPGLSGVVVSNGGSYAVGTGLVTWPTVGSLASGSATTYTVSTPVPATVGATGQLLATATANSTSPDNVPTDNIMAATVAVRPTTDLATTIVGPASANPGQAVTYTATFLYNGPSPVASATPTAQLPLGLSVVTVTDASGSAVSGASYSSSTGLLTLPTGSATVGTAQTYNLTFAAPAQTYTVSSGVTGSVPETVTTNNTASSTTTVGLVADVAVVVSGPATAPGRNPVTYVVTTLNNGPAPAANVATSLQLPAGLGSVAASAGGSYSNTTGLLTYPAATLAAGASSVYYATFTMPDAPGGGAISGLATATSTAVGGAVATPDPVSSNNSAGITTSVAPGTVEVADLVVSFPIAPAPAAAAGSTLSYAVRYANNGPDPAVSAAPVVYLLAGLAGVIITDASGSAVAGASYTASSGQIVFPTSKLASGAQLDYTVRFTAPGSGPVGVVAASSSATTDTGSGANQVFAQTTISAVYDPAISLTGPATSLPGVANTYTVSISTNGPSATPAVTQTVQLPTGLGVGDIQVAGQSGTLSGGVITFAATGATYTQSSGQLAFPAFTNVGVGQPNAITNTFVLKMPASGSLGLTAAIAASGDSNSGNNRAVFATVPANQTPVAADLVNNLRSARGNTAVAFPISPLAATDADGSLPASNGYTIVSIPTSGQGTLFYNGTASSNAVLAGQPISDPGLLFFKPASGFVGNAFFTYSAVDNSGATSNVARYTIPVAQDQSTTYAATPAKGGSSQYATGDVLAYAIDPNAATYTSSGLVYGTGNGTIAGGSNPLLQSGAANGLPTSGTNAVLAASGPSQNPGNALPGGVSLDPTTGLLYVSNAAALPRVTTATVYYVQVVTTDLNGGTNTALATFTLGAYPLPVVLTAFTAVSMQQDAHLHWSTATELHNDYFAVERSLDGLSFQEIARRAGQGSTLAATAYSYVDSGVGLGSTGIVYYRLRQIDADGTSTYSPVRTVRFTTPGELAIYPNPFTTALTLDLRALPATGAYVVSVSDAASRLLSSQTLPGGKLYPFDVSGLATGIYVIQVEGPALSISKRLVKE